LPCVAAQMQDQVARRVFVLAPTPPKLPVRQAAEAVLDPPGQLFQFARRIIQKNPGRKALHMGLSIANSGGGRKKTF
jgi:hypothetical protein